MGFFSKTNPNATPKRLAISSLACASGITLYLWWMSRGTQMEDEFPVWYGFVIGAIGGFFMEWQGIPHCGLRRKRKPKHSEPPATDG